MEIRPCDFLATRMQGALSGLTPQQVRDCIGFPANQVEDKDYGASWAFRADGWPCAVWYRGSVARVWGKREALEKVFGANHVQWFG